MESDFDGPDELPDGPDDAGQGWGDEPDLTADELGFPDPEDGPDAEADEPPDDDGSYADDTEPADAEPAENQLDELPDEPQPANDTVGADPDLLDADRTNADDFPLPILHLDDLPTPAGGPPWIDPSLLGTPDTPLDAAPDLTGTPEGARADLAALDADPGATWDTLRDAEDPAVHALARLWHEPE